MAAGGGCGSICRERTVKRNVLHGKIVSSAQPRDYALPMNTGTEISPVLIGRREVLSVDEMYRADASAIASGIAGEILMERAGRAVADAIRLRWSPRPVSVLCGPGNNGGDGFVIARLLAAGGWDVSVYLLGDRNALRGDAALNAGRWDGVILPMGMDALDRAGLVIDALFGAGLSRPVDGMPARIVEAVNNRKIPCVAVDMPSGIYGDSGAVLGIAPRCTLTVTFCRLKRGHLLLPGPEFCGEVLVADIGISDDVVAELAPAVAVNSPSVWFDRLRRPAAADHKYSRGQALVVGGAKMTGAARLAARAAARIGSGMVTIAAPSSARAAYAGDWPSFVVEEVEDDDGCASLFGDPRRAALLVGPGAGASQRTRSVTLAALATGKPTVLDADALTSFREDPEILFVATQSGNAVLTPHEGEFQRLFDISGDKIERCQAAARKSRATVLLKGADTVIAEPGGAVIVSSNGTPDLATAGSGDVLAGMIVGLLAQGMAPPVAAAAAAWLHGAAARRAGRGLQAGDLPDVLPLVLADLETRIDR